MRLREGVEVWQRMGALWAMTTMENEQKQMERWAVRWAEQ
ncbi:hypothetical protein EDD55_10865 [Varunaivibrio sulfuroxidans]|uniref:Uncharacterized protein n=1 Tax=Varunaivibrio sulfuroxidans TaxID=1773489 RepID=A0A4R3J8L5_9PROT|nr:hypothetical protein EDD55_10865 [Varunaivibrio sulfuroxidans]